jgi:phosphoglycerol transferase
MPGAWMLGDVLAAEGYNNLLMVGSDAAFGRRDELYARHGDAAIKDLFSAYEDGVAPENYNVFWGIEDIKLYAYARQELPKLAAADEPFCLSMLTVDTHMPSGYLCPQCLEEYEYDRQLGSSYYNTLSCASRQLSAFLDWLKAQDFYEDTTIFITGDHLTMAESVKNYHALNEPAYTRTIYNAFVNAQAETEHDRDRQFSTMDMYPTVLAAMGVQIEGDQLALGVNLFSGKPTLIEANGYEVTRDDLQERSEFYNRLVAGERVRG